MLKLEQNKWLSSMPIMSGIKEIKSLEVTISKTIS